MSASRIHVPPSPVARSLMTFAKQSASGVVRLSGRRVGTCEGLVTGVAAAGDDPSADTWLQSLGQLTERGEKAGKAPPRPGRSGVGNLVRDCAGWKSERNDTDALGHAPCRGHRRGRCTGRAFHCVSRGRTNCVDGGASENRTWAPLPGVTRANRIAFRHELGQRTSLLTSSAVGPVRFKKSSCVGLVLNKSRHAQLCAHFFYADPSAAARVAALVRAGVAIIDSGDPTMPPPPLRRAPTFSSPPIAPNELAYREQDDLDDESLPPPPPPTIKFDDPLATLETEMDVLESSRAPGSERAEQWKEIAACWEKRFGSLTEAARALRHAAAAAPDDIDAHQLAAQFCARVGRVDLARSHAYAAFAPVHGGQNPGTRAASVCQLRHLGRQHRRRANPSSPKRASTTQKDLKFPSSAGPFSPLWGVYATPQRRLEMQPGFARKPTLEELERFWAGRIKRSHGDVDLATEFARSLSSLEARSAGPWLITEAVVFAAGSATGRSAVSRACATHRTQPSATRSP